MLESHIHTSNNIHGPSVQPLGDLFEAKRPKPLPALQRYVEEVLAVRQESDYAQCSRQTRQEAAHRVDGNCEQIPVNGEPGKAQKRCLLEVFPESLDNMDAVTTKPSVLFSVTEAWCVKLAFRAQCKTEVSLVG